MTRRLRIEWSEGRKVTGLLAMPDRPRQIGVLLAHGAGAGQWTPFVVHIRNGLAAGRYPTMSFNYPYAEAGRRSPDQPKTALAAHGAAADRLSTYTKKVVLAGKSMGGRLGSHLAEHRTDLAGLIYYGYPIVSPASRQVRDTSHLDKVDVPQLFFAGTRDPLCPLETLLEVTAGLDDITVAIIEGGDHSFKVPQAVGKPYPEVLDDLVAIALDWLGGL